MSGDEFDPDYGPDEPAPQPLPPSPPEVHARPDDAAAWARSVPPGSDSLGVLALLDPARLSDEGRIDAIAAYEAASAWLTAGQNAMLASLTRQPGIVPGDKQWESLEVSCVLGISALAAERRLALARELTGGRLARAGQAMSAGRLSPWRAVTLSKELGLLGCDDRVAVLVQAEVLPRANELTFAQYVKAIRTSVMTHAAAVEDEQREYAKADRKVVRCREDRFGMTGLYAYLPTEAADAVYASLNRAAFDCDTNDPRTLDQRRADALVQLATTGGLNSASRSELKPAVNVTVAMSTLLGFDEQAAELNGQPIPASLARQLASDENGTWRRLLTDERGVLIDYGRTKYRPPTALAEFVKNRDRECVFPTCTRDAATGEIDHEIARADGGGTNEPNLAVVSSRHHHAKHEAGWKKQRLPDGSTEWTSPTGHTYVKPPATYPIDRTGLPEPDPGGDDPPF